MAKTKVKYQVEIPEVIARNPAQAIIDGFTCIYAEHGMEAVDAVLEAVMETVYPNAS